MGNPSRVYRRGTLFWQETEKGARTYSSARKKGKTFFWRNLNGLRIFFIKMGALIFVLSVYHCSFTRGSFFSYFNFISTLYISKMYKVELILESVCFWDLGANTVLNHTKIGKRQIGPDGDVMIFGDRQFSDKYFWSRTFRRRRLGDRRFGDRLLAMEVAVIDFSAIGVSATSFIYQCISNLLSLWYTYILALFLRSEYRWIWSEKKS